ncbi:hypothetical protein ACROYT_G014188 [Oculina patagonica]
MEGNYEEAPMDLGSLLAIIVAEVLKDSKVLKQKLAEMYPDVDDWICLKLWYPPSYGRKDQRAAVVGNDVFVVVPMSFGFKFQLFVLATSSVSSTLNAASSSPLMEWPTIIFICPLKSITEEQKYSKKFSLAVAELHNDSEMFNAIRTGEIQVVYAAAEQVLNEKFTSMLKEDCPFKTLNMGGAVDEFFSQLSDIV